MRRLIAAFVLLLPPLALLAFGWQLTADRDAVVEMQLRQLVDERLKALDRDINRWLMAELRELRPLSTLQPRRLAELRRELPLIRQIHILDRDGNWRFPETGQLSSLTAETVFAAMADEEHQQQSRPWQNFGQSFGQSGSAKAQSAPTADMEAAVAPEHGRKGWLVRYQGQQLQLLRWLDAPNGDVWLFEVSYPAMLAGLIGWLPDTRDAEPGSERYQLADGSARVLYAWGNYPVDDQQAPQAQLTLSAPLTGWHLNYYSKAAAANTALDKLSWLLIAVAIAVLSVLLGVWLWRQQQAELRLAEQRVSFVNQVSHELKTPLTNIRMYAELLQRKIGEQQGDASRQLGVVVSESQRLSRLINNVLSFGRGQRKQLELQRRPAVVDEVVSEVLDNWQIALIDAGITVEFEGNARREVLLDADILEQILNNLISNAEKYAAAGGRLSIRTLLTDRNVTLVIADNGPGIPRREWQKVFESFYRRADTTTEGASGTGIGLGLARDLARLHGGELKIVDNPQGRSGCSFELALEQGE